MAEQTVTDAPLVTAQSSGQSESASREQAVAYGTAPKQATTLPQTSDRPAIGWQGVGTMLLATLSWLGFMTKKRHD